MRRFLIVVGLVAVLIVLGVGGYLVGHSTGEDLDAAREQGTERGQRAGTARGHEEGYARGFGEGRAQSYPEAFRAGYRTAYRDVVEAGGYSLAADEPQSIPNPGR
jgi:hypothetical protein